MDESISWGNGGTYESGAIARYSWRMLNGAGEFGEFRNLHLTVCPVGSHNDNTHQQQPPNNNTSTTHAPSLSFKAHSVCAERSLSAH